MIKTLCIEGTKGAGKTTTITNLKNCLEKKGYTVTVKTPFYDVRPQLKELTGYNNTYPASLDAQAARICNKLLINQIQTDISARAKNEILIFDRGWLTGIITLLGSALSDTDKSTELKRWESLLIDTVFIHTKPANTLAVRQNELTFEVGLTNKETLDNDYILRHELIQKYQACVIAQVETFPLQPDKERCQFDLIEQLLKKIIRH